MFSMIIGVYLYEVFRLIQCDTWIPKFLFCKSLVLTIVLGKSETRKEIKVTLIAYSGFHMKHRKRAVWFVVCKVYAEGRYELSSCSQESVSGMYVKYFGNILSNI